MLMTAFSLAGGILGCLLVVAMFSPYVARIIAAAAMTWADAWDEWLEALGKHWRRHSAALLEVPRG